jgi:hypothetical protein
MEPSKMLRQELAGYQSDQTEKVIEIIDNTNDYLRAHITLLESAICQFLSERPIAKTGTKEILLRYIRKRIEAWFEPQNPILFCDKLMKFLYSDWNKPVTPETWAEFESVVSDNKQLGEAIENLPAVPARAANPCLRTYEVTYGTQRFIVPAASSDSAAHTVTMSILQTLGTDLDNKSHPIEYRKVRENILCKALVND